MVIIVSTFFYSEKDPSLCPYGAWAPTPSRDLEGPSKLVIRTWDFFVFRAQPGAFGPIGPYSPVLIPEPKKVEIV